MILLRCYLSLTLSRFLSTHQQVYLLAVTTRIPQMMQWVF
uniref:Uncharacterized protein n=1 Tax=Rhizophora mucronata TaxID=61149 RepID=A0A2P2PMA7_RHIMU